MTAEVTYANLDSLVDIDAVDRAADALTSDIRAVEALTDDPSDWGALLLAVGAVVEVMPRLIAEERDEWKLTALAKKLGFMADAVLAYVEDEDEDDEFDEDDDS